MEKSLFSLTWDKFHSSMSAGFSLLQQNGELVDLTLAADGHFIKVHKIILCIASPFIKDLMQSADCKHPVIFMNNMSYKTLCSILEYLYTGEVSVEEENLKSFLEAAKSLQIRGLEETFSISKDQGSSSLIVDEEEIPDDVSRISMSHSNNKTLEKIFSNSVKKEVEKVESTDIARSPPKKRKSLPFRSRSETKEFEGSSNKKILFVKEIDTDDMNMDSGSLEDDDALDKMDSISHTSKEEDLGSTTKKKGESTHITDFQYTVSNQGSLQMILNRFIYNLCSRGMSTARGPVRRWRCVQYRNLDCPASAVTDHNVVVKRTNLHNHPFHDKRILDKIQRKAVYSALQAKDMFLDKIK